MRKALIAACLLFAVPSFAQQSKFQLSVFATDPGYSYTESGGSRVTGGLGAALEYRWDQRWALELQVTREDRSRTLVRIDPLDPTVPEFQQLHGTAWPVDVLAHYRFGSSSRWQPFVGAGLRYERSPFRQFAVNQVTAEIDGGVHLMITPQLSLRLDAKQLLANEEGNFGFNLRPSVGLGWRF